MKNKINDWEDVSNTSIDDWEDIPVSKEPSISQLESGIRGAASGVSLGLADEITGGGEALLDKIKGSDEPISDLYGKRVEESRQAYREAEKAHPGTYTTGEVAGGIGAAFIPGLGAAKGAKLASVAGRAALEGAIQGYGGSEASGLDLAKDTAIGSVIGGTLGAAGGALGNKIESALNARKLSKNLARMAEEKSALALGANKSDFNTAKKLLASRKLGRQALDQGIVSPLASTDEMLGRALNLKETGGEGLNSLYSKIDESGLSSFSPNQVADTFESKFAPEYRTPINKAEVGQFENTLQSMKARGDSGIDPATGKSIYNNIPMSEAQALKNELKSVAYPKGKAPIDPSAKQLMAQDAVRTVDEAMMQSAEGASGKLGADMADAFKKSKSQYGTGIEAEKLLMNKQAGEKTTNPLKTVSNMVDVGAVAAAPFTGGESLKGLLGKKLVEAAAGKRHQVIAIGADKLSKLIENNPEKLGKFANVLSSAAKRGPKALAAANLVLQNRDPEYGDMVKALGPDNYNDGVITKHDTSDEAIDQMLEKANANNVNPEIVSHIENMKSQDPDKRSRSMFSIMQQPGLRQMFKGD